MKKTLILLIFSSITFLFLCSCCTQKQPLSLNLVSPSGWERELLFDAEPKLLPSYYCVTLGNEFTFLGKFSTIEYGLEGGVSDFRVSLRFSKHQGAKLTRIC